MNTEAHYTIKYRSDIDGLRAVAILAVLFFHAFPQVLPGGFVGVDVFFVISGFLISSNIFTNLNSNTFSFLDFYSRRINRIFPALFVTLLFCLVFGWFALLDNEYLQLGKHVVGAAGFISNIVLWREAGYFDTLSDLKPLLHMWSLGIEEQFYFIWPVLLWASWKKRRVLLPSTICILAILCSFGYSISILKENPTAAFYSPLSRMWELIFGSLLAYLMLFPLNLNFTFSKFKRNVFSVLGFALIILAILITKEKNFPGFYALIPIVGTFLILAAKEDAILNRYILSNRGMIWIGLISYPLYLWHWVLLSYARILVGEVPTVSVRIAMIILSFVLAWLTYKFIEIPLRRYKKNFIKVICLSLLMLLVGLSGYYLYRHDGLKNRSVVQQNYDTKNRPFMYTVPVQCALDFIDKKFGPRCQLYPAAKAERPTIAIWGDSSSLAWAPVFMQLGRELDFNIIILAQPSCPPLMGVRKTYFGLPESRLYCRDATLSESTLKFLEQTKPAIIFYLGAWNIYSPELKDSGYKIGMAKEYLTESLTTEADEASTLLALKNQLPVTVQRLDAIAKLVIFKSWPVLPIPPVYPIKRISFLQPELKFLSKEVHVKESQFVNDIFSTISTQNTTYLDPARIVCDSADCKHLINGYHMYGDVYHVTPQGSLFLKQDLLKVLNEAHIK
ncbi:MAG: acyltransferase family protein [Bdellovibrionota bacterium]